MFLANVVFPAPSAAYVASLFFPLAGLFGLITEYVVFEKFQREVASAAKLLWVVIAVNLFSWVVGIVLSSLLPGGLVPKLVGDADHPIHILIHGAELECDRSFEFLLGLSTQFRTRIHNTSLVCA